MGLAAGLHRRQAERGHGGDPVREPALLPAVRDGSASNRLEPPGPRGIASYTVAVYDRRVIRSFRDGATEQVFYGDDTKVARKLPKPLWPLIRRKLDVLHAAKSL